MPTEVGSAYVAIYPNMKGFSKGIEGGLDSLSVAAGNLISSAVMGVADFLGSGLEKGISRLDTIQNFPKLMTAFGYSSKDASAAVKSVADHLVGLPGSTDEVLQLVQALSDSTSSLSLATSTGLAFNDMLTAAGADSATATIAMRTFDQVMGGGVITGTRWQALASKMPKQMNMIAESILGVGATKEQLGEALQGGEVSLEQFAQAMSDLGPEFEAQARAMSFGIGTALSNIPNRLAAGWESILEVFGQRNIATLINDFSTGVKNGMQDFSTWLGNFIDWGKHVVSRSGLAEAFDQLLSNITGSFDRYGLEGLIKKFADAGINALAGLVGWINAHWDSISGFFSTIGDAAGRVVDALANSGIADAFGNFVDAVGKVIDKDFELGASFDALVGSVEPGATSLAGALNFLSENWMAVADVVKTVAIVLAGVGLAGVFQKIATAAAGLWAVLAANPLGAAITIIGTITAALTYFFTQTEFGQQVWKAITETIGNAIESIRKWIMTNLYNAIMAVLQWANDVKRFWENAWKNVKKTVGDAIKGIVKFFTDLVNGGKKNFNLLLTAVRTIFNNIKTTASNIWNGIKTSLSNIFNGIKTTASNVFNGVKTTLSNIFNGIKTTATNVWNGIKDAVTKPIEAAKKTLESIVNGVKSFLSNVFGGIKSDTDSKWKSISGAITGPIEAAKGVVGTAIGGIQGIINSLTGKSVDVGVNDKTKAGVDSAKQTIKTLTGKTVTIDTKNMVPAEVDKANRALRTLQNKTVSINFHGYQSGIKGVDLSVYTSVGGNKKIVANPVQLTMASGGIVTTATAALVGEAGDEAVIPLSNRNRVRPFARAVAAEMGGGGMTVNVYNPTFNNGTDIDMLTDRINRRVSRQRAGALA